MSESKKPDSEEKQPAAPDVQNDDKKNDEKKPAKAPKDDKKKVAKEPAADAEPEVKKVQFDKLGEGGGDIDSAFRMDMLMDVVLPVSIELGRSKMFVKEILELERGSIIELDKLAGEPVDLLINAKKLAEGEVVVVDKNFGIRITNLIDPSDRLKSIENE